VATLLTIDWDFFIQNRGEGDPQGQTVFPDGRSTHNWLMFDWGAFEGHAPQLGSILWWTRASHWLRCGLDIREDLAILPEKGCVDPVKFSHILKEQFPNLLDLDKYVGDSHAWAISVVRELMESHGPIEVVSFDAHCDLGYCADKVSRETKLGHADCGSWLYHSLEKGWVSSVEIVYPDWKGMVEWQQASQESFLDPFRDKVTAHTWSDWVTLGRKYEDLEGVHLCRSSNWTPPWLDQRFLELMELISDGWWFNLDDEDDNPFGGPLIGGYNALEAREFDWDAVKEDALKMANIFGKPGEKVAPKSE
jgi:hypothetical protein